MKGISSWIVTGAGIGLAYEAIIQISEFAERHHCWQWAQSYKAASGKPILRIGIRRSFLEPPNGDVTLDIDPAILRVPGGVQGDVRNMYQFDNAQFAVTFCEHVMEHLHEPADVPLAVQECCRVADYAIFLSPSVNSLIAVIHATHHLALLPLHGGFLVYRIGETEQSGLYVPVEGN